jgi:hypothetical protein
MPGSGRLAASPRVRDDEEDEEDGDVDDGGEECPGCFECGAAAGGRPPAAVPTCPAVVGSSSHAVAMTIATAHMATASDEPRARRSDRRKDNEDDPSSTDGLAAAKRTSDTSVPARWSPT